LSIYREFASLYAAGQYPEFSATVAQILPSILRRLNASPRDVLDLACGEGTFAVRMAKKGFRVTGVDQSPNMLQFARRKARNAKVHVNFIRRDMRSLQFEKTFDLVTCWFDSLNYLLKLSDLEKTFKGVYRALRANGLFIFDMNTIYTLSDFLQRTPCRVEHDTPKFFTTHRLSYNKRRLTATFKITGFVRRGQTWTRIDEEHHERGYMLNQIKNSLKTAGLRQLALWGSIRKLTPPKRDTRRVWFVAQRPMR
jgi:ubiquinone/menaquinone biosynthesis C-methylase UbiE